MTIVVAELPKVGDWNDRIQGEVSLSYAQKTFTKTQQLHKHICGASRFKEPSLLKYS